MFQSPQLNPAIDHGSPLGTNDGQSCEKEQETISHMASEDQTPPF